LHTGKYFSFTATEAIFLLKIWRKRLWIFLKRGKDRGIQAEKGRKNTG